MRLEFWRGVVAGSILGATLGMLVFPRRRVERQGFLSRRITGRTQRVIKGLTKTVDDLGKASNKAQKVIKGVTRSVGDLIK